PRARPAAGVRSAHRDLRARRPRRSARLRRPGRRSRRGVRPQQPHAVTGADRRSADCSLQLPAGMSERVWAVGAETELPWSQLPFEVVSSDGAAAVLGTSARTPSRHVCAAVERLLRGHRAALSDPMTRPDDFRHARRQVDVLLPVAEPGTCATPETARELVVLRTLVDALHQLPSLGTDPFAALT